MQCAHFSETCVIAELEGEVVGWVSAYINPQQVNTIFIWQMAVSEKARGQSLAFKMLNHLLSRAVCSEVTHLETTITKDNQASRSVFRKLASQLNTACAESSYFVRDIHFGGKHADEYLFKIGPISTNAKRMIKIKEETL
ncbi:diaminobutyrate acetyltransferase [Catenovulum agarivorans]|uniref:diaminobutyrate acetyltransferase n=1 Tax=Catenovulum agarivorans TaxID=1172192 RepID=UPI0004BB545A|nr:diaminobutyrate acetyltransferase [Catenovulum agarivorans]